MTILKGTDFDNLLNVTDPADHFSKLLSALVPFYQVEHRCFKFGVNETLEDDYPEVDGRAIRIPITLRGVFRIIGLPIDGEPVIEDLEGVHFAALCNELLGAEARENQAEGQVGACISLSWLLKEFGNMTEDEISEPEDFAHYLHALVLYVIGLKEILNGQLPPITCRGHFQQAQMELSLTSILCMEKAILHDPAVASWNMLASSDNLRNYKIQLCKHHRKHDRKHKHKSLKGAKRNWKTIVHVPFVTVFKDRGQYRYILVDVADDKQPTDGNHTPVNDTAEERQPIDGNQTPVNDAYFILDVIAEKTLSMEWIGGDAEILASNKPSEVNSADQRGLLPIKIKY
ncbi:protein MAIN-LIKE 2 [Sesamum alatum]|uniref:Protein MAIN-LIKE 2 n=1 Tax=Sesamum alatum TaxID=300844 RepID=A0AAE1Y404_9LAMI|nr:protein MAIN-LIKE 2 [Sesamum alatum]